jgi:hypothetical protein
MEHVRADRRRAQWRRAQRRKAGTDTAIGALHDLGCKGPRYCTCNPIPVYRSPEEAAA